MKIVFFGDSITDSGRNPHDPSDLGVGFVKLAANKLRLLYPDKTFEILNRGVGGDRTEQLLSRIEKDVADEHPDIVVLQVGINDVWHRFTEGVIVSPEQFRRNYTELVSRLKATGARVIALQPFVLRMGDKPRLRPTLETFNAIIGEIALKEQIALIPVDEIFMGVTQDVKPDEFALDGIHPTHHGCRYLADLVIKELKKSF